MGLKKMQEDLQKKKEQESNLITDLTEALEQSKTENNQLQQQLQDRDSENSSLKAELTTAYKQIQALSSSDLQLRQAQQLKASAAADLENSRQLLKEQKSLQQLNKQKEKELTSKKEQLEKQKKELKEKESSLQKTIEDAKKQAETDAKAALADGWNKLDKAKKAAEKEQDDERQQAENLKEEVQRELDAAKKATSEAAEKGYQDAMSNYKMVIRFVLIFAAFLGLIEMVKHWYIINLYYDWYIDFNDSYGLFAAAGVATAAVVIFSISYFAVWSACDSQEYYLGLSIRLMLLVWLFAAANAVPANAAAIIIYLSCVVVGIVRWMINHK